MRKNIFVFLLVVGVNQSVSAYNKTIEMAALAGVHVATVFLSDHEAVAGAKFGLQFAAGLYDPRIAAVTLGVQHVYLGDKTALGSGLSMANRAIAESFASYYNKSKTEGFLVAAGVDLGVFWVVQHFLLDHWDLLAVRDSLYDWSTPGALVNSFYQGILGLGNTPEMAGLLTSAVTGVASLTVSDSFQTTFVAETGFRLVPSMVKMMVSNPEALSAVNALGMFLLYRANQMKPGHLETLTGATGVSFLISAVIDMVERFKKAATALED